MFKAVMAVNLKSQLQDNNIEQESSHEEIQLQNPFTILSLNEKLYALQNHPYDVKLRFKSLYNDLELPKQEDQILNNFLLPDRQLSFDQNSIDDYQSSTQIKDDSIDRQDKVQVPIFNHSQRQKVQTVQKIRGARKRYLPSGSENVCADYPKNISSYVFTKVFKALFNKNYLPKMQKQCHKRGINLKIFRDYFLPLTKGKGGPNSILSFLEAASLEQIPMYEMFDYLICKYLRGRYMLFALQNGKMKDLSAYIKMKNRYFLYFSKLFDPQQV